MPNPLTGDYDALLQIDVDVVNAALAALHEQPRDAINLPHAAAGWLDVDVSGVHGFVQAQMGTPRISAAAAGGDARLAFTQPARIRFSGIEGTTPLPEYLAGDVAATFELRYRMDPLLGATLDVVTVEPLVLSNHPAAPPLSGPDRAAVEGAINDFARLNVGPITERLRLPAAVTGVRFAAARDGGRTALCMLVALGAGPAARSAPSPARRLTDAAHGFAVAISRDYLVARLDAAFGAIPRSFSASVGIFPVDFTIDRIDVRLVPRVPSVPASRDVVILDLAGRGTLHAVFAFPFSFTVAQAFEILVGDASVALVASGDPVIGISGLDAFTWIPGVRDGLRLEVAAQRDALLRRANDEIARALVDLQPALLFERAGLPGRARLSDVVVDADGLILRGPAEAGASQPAVASLNGTTDLARPDEVVLDAHASWIPGGVIDRYRWTGGGAPRTDLVRFVNRARPGSPSGADLVWLTIEGRQLIAPGTWRSVRATRSFLLFCAPSVGQAIQRASLPGRLSNTTIVNPGQYLEVPCPQSQGAKAALAGHVDLARVRSTGYNAANVLVYLEGDDPDSGRLALRQWIDGRSEDAAALLVVVVGAKDRDRAWWGKPRASQTCIMFADDRAAGWTTCFSASARPAFFLIGRDGDPLWQHAGPIAGTELAKTIDGLAPGSPVLTWSTIGTAVAESDVPPDFLIETAPGFSAPLRKLRGTAVTLCFCKPWSAPCLETLERLASANNEDESIVIAICDGEPIGALADFVKRRQLAVTIVANPAGEIGGQYGVWCWPTTVTIAANGRIAGVDVGPLPPPDAIAPIEEPSPQPA